VSTQFYNYGYSYWYASGVSVDPPGKIGRWQWVAVRDFIVIPVLNRINADCWSCRLVGAAVFSVIWLNSLDSRQKSAGHPF
jgi:hypothetical protein